MFDLSVLLCDAGDRVAGFLQYSTDLFDPGTIATVGADLETLLTAIAADPDLPVASLPASLGEARKSRETAPVSPAAAPPQEREIAQDRAEARRALLERQKRLRRG
jgi:non-ribosomal peptide synthetase component F